MALFLLTLLFLTEALGQTTITTTLDNGRRQAATPFLQHKKHLKNAAGIADGAHRGPAWYDYKSSSEDSDTASDSDSDTSYSLSSQTEVRSSSNSSSEASSKETHESAMVHRYYRECTPCPADKMKSFKNRGIKWICGAYQRARRTFKSVCMMRYRNCQDGTMFVKISDHRCKDDPYHGRNWFYVYKV